MKDQEPVSGEERPDWLERGPSGRTGPTSRPLGVEVAQVHGVEVKGHVRSAKQDKVVDQPVAAW